MPRQCGIDGVNNNDYYVCDAQGNVLAVYQGSSESYAWKGQHLYGSSRLGMVKPNLAFTISYTPVSNDYAYAETTDPVNALGNRSYELTNHLGNVLATISDERIAISSGPAIDHYEADVPTAQD